MSSPRTITAEELAAKNGSVSVVLIDVRTPAEFREVHATMARNVPLESFNATEFMQAENGSANGPVYVICQSGVRGSKAAQQLVSAGRRQVFNVSGGTQAWVDAGLPVVRGKKTISLERQVRIAAGFVALAGALATLATGNVYFSVIPAFVGAGLMFAGITNTCGMAMMLAKMPWNQCKSERCTA